MDDEESVANLSWMYGVAHKAYVFHSGLPELALF
jgi:hypothetical protein